MYDFELIVVELIVVGWVAWSRKSAKAFFSCESSSFKTSTVFLSSVICVWLCSWPQVGQRKGSVLAASSLCCSELTLAQQLCNHAWHFPSQKRASSLPSTMALLQTAQGSLFLLGGIAFSCTKFAVSDGKVLVLAVFSGGLSSLRTHKTVCLCQHR